MFTQDRIDALYSAIEKLNSITEDIHDALFADLPFDDPDDPDCSLWGQKKGVQELCEFKDIISNAADFAQNAINSLEAV